MSETDTFIAEVTEEVRRDRLFTFFRRYGWIVVLAVITVVGWAAYREWSRAQLEASARVFGDRVVAAQAKSDAAARLSALEAIKARGAQAAVLDFAIADAAQSAGKPKQAEAALARVAGDKTVPAAYRQLAELKRLILLGDAMPADQRRAAFETLAQPGKPYRPLALEQIALMDVAKGDDKAALKQYQALLKDPQLTGALRQRAAEMVVALGGTSTTG